MHDGGIHILLCDGAVKFISENIDAYLFASIVTREGNEVVDEF